MDIKITSETETLLTQTVIEFEYEGNAYSFYTHRDQDGNIQDSYLRNNGGDDVTEEESELFEYLCETF